MLRLVALVTVGALAGLLAVALLLTLDARRILLDTDAWTDTSAVVLEDDDTRAALVAVVMDASVARLTCESTIARIAVNTSIVQRGLARVEGSVDDLLSTERARTLWRDANRSGHEAFVRAARTDRPVGEDELVQLGALLDRVATVTDIAGLILRRGSSGDGDAPGDECSDASERLAVLDPDAMRAAADASRTLHDARWLPRAIGGAIGACLVALVLLARSAWRIGIAVAVAGIVALAAALVLRGQIADGASPLVDGIRSAANRELAEAIIRAALAPTARHLEAFAIGAGVVALLGCALLAVGMLGERRRARARTRP